MATTSLTSIFGLSIAFASVVVVISQTDLTRVPGAKGDYVVDTVVDLLRHSCIFPSDKYFLRRLSFVESLDGLASLTYRPGYYGGIWQVSYDQFNVTKITPSVDKYFPLIQDQFDIDWPTVSWTDLRKPLYSALAISLYIQAIGIPVPRGVEEQSLFWTKYIERGTNLLSYNFTHASSLLQDSCFANQTIDLLFVLDGSSSISPEDFERAKGFVKNTVLSFNIGPMDTRVSVMTYSSGAHVEFYLNEYNNKEETLNNIQNITWRSGTSATDEALDMAVDMVFTSLHGSRTNVPKAVILFSDGQSNDFYKTKTAAARVRAEGITIFAVGVGNNLDLFELQSVASDPDCTHLFLVNSYSEIDTLKQEIQHASCRTHFLLRPGQTFKCRLNGGTCYVQSTNISNIQISVDCASALIYTSYVNPYPGYASYEVNSVTTPGKPTVIPVLDADGNFYLAVQTTLDHGRLPDKECYATLTEKPITLETEVICKENGVERECKIPEDLVKYRPQLCSDNVNWLDIANPCTKEAILAGTVVFPHPYNVNMYITCDLTGKMYVTACPIELTFDKTTLQCGFKIEGNKGNETTVELNPCSAENLIDGHYFFPFVNDHHKFIHCDAWGHPWIMDCNSGFVWDQKETTCVEEFLIGVTAHPDYNPCTTEAIANGRLFFPYPDDNKYYIRCDAWGDAYVMPCEPGTVWNQAASVCTYA